MAKLKVAIEGGHDISTRGKETPYIVELGRRIKENEFNDGVIGFLKEELERCGFEVLDVSPERGTDTPLRVRTDRANEFGADIYISIHFNAFDGSFGGANPEGHSIHIYPNSEKGRELAEKIYKHLVKGTEQKHRGIIESNFHVLRESEMPAILSENGFMDNKREAMLMLNVDFQKEVAVEHCKGICDYFNVPYVKEPEPVEEPKSDVLYRVQTGAFRYIENAIELKEDLESDGYDTYLVKSDGLYKVQTGAFGIKNNALRLAKRLKSEGYSTYITTKSGEPVKYIAKKEEPKIKVGSYVKIKTGAKSYEGIGLADFVYRRVYKVSYLQGNRAVLTLNGTIVTSIHKDNLILR